MRGRGDVGARQLSDQLHEDGRDGRAQREDQVVILIIQILGNKNKHFTGSMALDFEPISPWRLLSSKEKASKRCLALSSLSPCQFHFHHQTRWLVLEL